MKTLVIDDNAEFNAFLAQTVRGMGHEAVCAGDGAEALRLAVEARPQVALVDLDLPDMHGLKLLPWLFEALPGLHVIIITGGPSLESAVQAIKLGADNYIQKPIDTEDLRRIMAGLAARLSPVPVLDRLREVVAPDLESCHYSGDPVMLSVYARVQQVADKERIPVMVGGETGTGKQHIARLLHLLSPRAAKPFLEINCAALPETLLEAELFGYEPGAFTDARKAKPGLFEAAQGGTLFLDEVGEMSLAMQAKLLKVLEQKSARRLGGVRDHAIDARLVAASNRDLTAEVRSGRMRADLYYRLNVFPISLPPLRGRTQAIRDLAQHFHARACRDYQRPVVPLSEAVLQRLCAFSWPGNVRELKGHIERMVIEEEGSGLAPDALAEAHIQAEAEGHSQLERLLQEHRWNRTEVAKLLGISRPTLLARIRKAGLAA